MFTRRPLTEDEQALENACASRPMAEIIEKALRAGAAALSDAAMTDQHADWPAGGFVDALVRGAAPDYDPIRVETAVTRARTVTSIIAQLRDAVSNGQPKGAILASYDAELSRLAHVPGVMAALLDDMDAEWRDQDQTESSDDTL